MSGRTWVFTLNNYTDKDEQLFKDLETSYTIFGKEVGDSGTPHLQGYITFNKTTRLSALKKINDKVHWEPAKVSEAAANYCMKDKDYFIKDSRKQGSRTDLENVVQLIKDGGLKNLVEQNPEAYIKFHNGIEKYAQFIQKDRDFKPEITWIYGPTGVGKTRKVYDDNKDLSVWISGRDLKFWDGYNNQDVVLLDDFRGDFCTFHELLRILDRYPYTVNIKGGSRKLNSKKIYITSCYPPDQVYQTREDIKQLIRRIDHIIHMQSQKIFKNSIELI